MTVLPVKHPTTLLLLLYHLIRFAQRGSLMQSSVTVCAKRYEIFYHITAKLTARFKMVCLKIF